MSASLLLLDAIFTMPTPTVCCYVEDIGIVLKLELASSFFILVMDFNTLPYELLLSIFYHASARTLITSTSSASKSWRVASLDPALWKKFYQHYYPLDPSIPADGQWYYAFVNKQKLFQAMRGERITMQLLFSKDKAIDDINNKYLSFASEADLFKEDTVIVTPRKFSIDGSRMDYEELGCHTINIRTEEMNVLSHEYYPKISGEYTALIGLDKTEQSSKMIVTKTPEMLDDIMKPNIIRNEFELENTNNWIWNADRKTPSMIYKQYETYHLFNWSTGERHPLPTFKNGMLYKDAIVEIDEMSARVLRSDIELHKYDFKARIEAVCMNDKLIVFATKDDTVHIIAMNTDQRTSLKIPHLTPHEKRVRERIGGSPRGSLRPYLYLYEDLLVGKLDSMLFFCDLNRAKELTRISFQSTWPVNHFFRASNTEFICRAGSNKLLAIRIELDPNPIKILIMPPKSDIIKLSIDGSKFNSYVFTQVSLSSAVKTFYFVKTEQERFGVVCSLDSEEEINARATELFATLPNKEKMTDFVIFKCKKSIFTVKQHDSSKPIRICGAVVVFYERFMNGRWQYATPEQWPDTIVNFQLNKSM